MGNESADLGRLEAHVVRINERLTALERQECAAVEFAQNVRFGAIGERIDALETHKAQRTVETTAAIDNLRHELEAPSHLSPPDLLNLAAAELAAREQVEKDLRACAPSLELEGKLAGVEERLSEVLAERDDGIETTRVLHAKFRHLYPDRHSALGDNIELLGHIEAHIANLENKLERAPDDDGHVRELRTQRDRARELAVEYVKERDAARAELSGERSGSVQLAGRIKELESKLVKGPDSVLRAALREQLHEPDDKASDQDLVDLVGLLHDANLEYESRVDALTSDVERFKSELESADCAACRELELKVQRLESGDDTASGQLARLWDRLEKELETSRGRSNLFEAELTKASRNLTQRANRIAELESDLESAENNLQHSHGEREAAADVITRLESKLTAELSGSEVARRIRDVEADHDMTEGALDVSRRRVAQLESELADIVTRSHAEELTRLESDLEATKETLARSNADRATYRSELEKRTSEKRSVENELLELASKLTTSRQRCDDLDGELAETSNNLIDANTLLSEFVAWGRRVVTAGRLSADEGDLLARLVGTAASFTPKNPDTLHTPSKVNDSATAEQDKGVLEPVPKVPNPENPPPAQPLIPESALRDRDWDVVRLVRALSLRNR